MPKLLLLILLAAPGIAIAQSPFDGAWRIDPASFKVPEAPTQFLLANGVFQCQGCLAVAAIKADGRHHPIPDSAYWNAASVRSLDARTVEIKAKKNGRTYYTETDTVSADGEELTQLVRDTTEAEAVTTATSFHRIGKGPFGAHAISGSWRAYKVEKSPNSLIIRYKCTAEGFSAETPLGEKYDAKFDGKFVLTEDDPGQTMVAVKRINERTVETAIKRGDRIAGGSRLTVSADGQTLSGVFFDPSGKQTGAVVMHKQP
jgi:hypothetical protein